MRRMLPIALLFPVLAMADTAIKTEFPEGTQATTSEEIRKRFVGNSFTIKPAAGAEMRLQYKEDYVFINVGQRSDSGKWRAEGSSVCIEWRVFPGGCSEVRTLGDAIFTRRTINGEIVEMLPR